MKSEESGESFTIYETPQFPQTTHDPKKMYGMNLYALQMNNLTDSLKVKLPPTDSRLRPDMRLWENASMS